MRPSLNRLRGLTGMVLLLGCFQAGVDAAGVDLTNCTVSIAPFRGNKAAAVSYTFDDGLRNQYLLAAPILERLNIPATFLIIAGEVEDTKQQAEAKKAGAWGGITWDEVRSLAAKGFEIGNHSYSHPNLTKVDDAMAREEIEKSAAKLKVETGVYPVSFAYPYNASDERVAKLVLKHHALARDFQRGVGKNDETPDGINAWIDELITGKKWGVAMIHGLTDGFDPLKPEVLEANLRHAKSRQDDLWIDTFGNIGRYVQASKAAQVRIISAAARSVTFALDTSLSSDLFNVPLTIVIKLPLAVHARAKTADGKSMATVIVGCAILVECVPGGKAVIVNW